MTKHYASLKIQTAAFYLKAIKTKKRKKKKVAQIFELVPPPHVGDPNAVLAACFPCFSLGYYGRLGFFLPLPVCHSIFQINYISLKSLTTWLYLELFI